MGLFHLNHSKSNSAVYMQHFAFLAVCGGVCGGVSTARHFVSLEGFVLLVLFFQSCRCSVEIVSTLVPAKSIDTLAKNKTLFCVVATTTTTTTTTTTMLRVRCFRMCFFHHFGTYLRFVELNVMFPTHDVSKNMTSSLSLKSQSSWSSDFFLSTTKKHNNKHPSCKIFSQYITHQVFNCKCKTTKFTNRPLEVACFYASGLSFLFPP